MKKLSYMYVKKIIESENYTLISNTYNSAYDKLWLKCKNGHKFVLTWNSWKKGRRCPFCKSGRIYYDDIFLEFKKENYKLLTTRSEYKSTKTVLKYECPNGHIGYIKYQNWKNGVRCKQCFIEKRRLDFDVVRRAIKNENYEILSDSNEYVNYNSKLKIKCNKGHVYQSSYQSWKAGSRCPICANKRRSNKLKLDYEYIKSKFEDESYKLVSDTYETAFTKLKVICPNNHEYEVRWNDWQQGTRCPKCGRYSSKGETELYNFLCNLVGKENICRNDRELISPYELDIVLPEYRIAIEYCGLYWHSELFVDKTYHLKKLEKCRNINYRLITIFEDEWLFKKDVVEYKLKYILDKSDAIKIYARQCYIKEIPYNIKNEFLTKYHLQNTDISAINLGLFFKNILLSVMTFSKGSIAKGHRSKKGIWELNRFATNYSYNVVGGASKLLNYFKNNYDWIEIFSYADRRWSEGRLYYILGFVLDRITPPNYWYSKDGVHRIHRFNLRKTESEKGTEIELRANEGYFRIWDCGHLKFVYYN